MKLLLDQNLSRRLIATLAELFPGSSHTESAGLDRAPDIEVWRHAAEQGCLLVTKDADFHQLSLMYGAPPKVIWIRRGNASTAEVAHLLRHHVADLAAFTEDPSAVFLALG